MYKVQEEIIDFLKENNIEILKAEESYNDFYINKNILFSLKVNNKDFKCWKYFFKRLNEKGNICSYSYEYSTQILDIYILSDNLNTNNVLTDDLHYFLDILKKKYFLVNPKVKYMSMLVKPTHRCNMNCKMCYDEPFRKSIHCDMSFETLDKLLYSLSQYTEGVQFIWHGGEATMMGQEWFEKVFAELIPKYPMLHFDFSLMSNGYLIDDSWIKLFKKLGIDLGVSYNAYFQKEIRSNKKTYYDLEALTKICNENDKKIGVIDVITNKNYKDMIKIYEYYKKVNLEVAFNIVFNSKQSNKNKLELTPEDFVNEFLKYFKYWLYDKDGMNERSAKEALGFVIGSTKACCANQDCRGLWLGINPMGDLYPCDRYFPEKYKLGNIKDFENIGDVFYSDGYINYFQEINTRFKTKCKDCNYFTFCNGGCNASAIESTGSACGVEETHCKIFQLKFNGVYDILRDVDIFDPSLNKVAKQMLLENFFYSVKDINKMLKSQNKDYILKYEPDNLFNCSEYKIFRGINFIKSCDPTKKKHIDFIYNDSPEIIEKNKKQREKDLLDYLKNEAIKFI